MSNTPTSPGATARRAWRLGLLTLAGVAVAASASGVYAMAAAQTSATQGITSGQLSLAGQAVAATPLGTDIAQMLPGETANRYVTVTAGGTITSSNVVMTVAGSSNALSNALRVGVTACSVAWTSGGACGGTSTPIMSGVTASSLLTAEPTVLATGLAPSQSVHLRVSLSLPSGAQTTTDGVPPAGSYQNQSTNLSWHITALQAGATVTNG